MSRGELGNPRLAVPVLNDAVDEQGSHVAVGELASAGDAAEEARDLGSPERELNLECCLSSARNVGDPLLVPPSPNAERHPSETRPCSGENRWNVPSYRTIPELDNDLVLHHCLPRSSLLFWPDAVSV